MMATELVACNGIYLASRLREVIIPRFQTFIDVVVPDVLSAFRDLEARAKKVSDTEYERLGARSVGEDSDGDLGGAAETAFDAGIVFYQMMSDFRQATVNLLTVGLFHLVEQQLVDISTDGLFTGLKPLKDGKLSNVEDWYLRQLDLDLAELDQWIIISGELRYVANTVKHAEGSAARNLRTQKPELFRDPILSQFSGMRQWMQELPLLKLGSPMTGDGLYVPDGVLTAYGNAVVEFMEALATKFEKLGQDRLGP